MEVRSFCIIHRFRRERLRNLCEKNHGLPIIHALQFMTRSYFFSKFLVFRRFELWISKIRIFPDWSIYYSLWKGHLPIVFLSRYDAGSPWIPAWTTCSSGSSRPARRVIGRAALREHCTAAYIFRIKEWFTMQFGQLKKKYRVFPHGSQSWRCWDCFAQIGSSEGKCCMHACIQTIKVETTKKLSNFNKLPPFWNFESEHQTMHLTYLILPQLFVLCVLLLMWNQRIEFGKAHVLFEPVLLQGFQTLSCLQVSSLARRTIDS